MVQFRICLLLAALCACCDLGASDIVPPKTVILPVDVKVTPTAQTTTEEQKTEATLPDITTTSETVTTPDPKQTAPTTKTPTTTTPTTTTPATTTSTTTTSTTPAPTPTPAPAPVPIGPPEQGNWNYTNVDTNVTCIKVQFAAQLNITYNKVVDHVISLAYVIRNVPANATVVGGSCDANEQTITLGWPLDYSITNITNNMTLTYTKNDTLKSYALKSLNFSLSPELFVNASSKANVELKHGADWQIPYEMSYRCMVPSVLHMEGDTASGAAASLTFTKLQEEAFRTVNETGFSIARECGGGDVPDAVPIAVGCALGGLVLVVLVAYLVGRRRSAARGYLSM